MVVTDSRHVPERRAPITVAHEQAAVPKTKQMRRQPPDADRPRRAPAMAAIGGLTLQRLARVRGIVIAELHNDPAVAGFDGVALVILRNPAIPPAPNLPHPPP